VFSSNQKSELVLIDKIDFCYQEVKLKIKSEGENDNVEMIELSPAEEIRFLFLVSGGKFHVDRDVHEKRAVDDQVVLMAEITPEYVTLQVASSENLRAGGQHGLKQEERIFYFCEAKKYAKEAFLAARQNVYARALAWSQYQCANGLLLLAENDYNSVTINVDDEDAKNENFE
jgi:hypothetical protein